MAYNRPWTPESLQSDESLAETTDTDSEYEDDSSTVFVPRGTADTYVDSSEDTMYKVRVNYAVELEQLQRILASTFKDEKQAYRRTEDFRPRARRMLSYIEQRDYCSLMEEIWALERQNNISEQDLQALKRNTLPILLAVPVPTLQAIVQGDIAGLETQSLAVQQDDIPMGIQPVLAPVVYRLTLTDRHGRCPKPQDMEIAYRVLQQYASGTLSKRLRKRIDRYRSRRHKSKVGRYLCKQKNGQLVPQKSKQAALKTFLRTPCNRSRLSYIGFTGDAMHRKLQHERHHNSNFIMNLLESILAVHQEVNGTYRQRFQPLFRVFEPTHGIAEIIFSRLAGCSINYGGAVYHPAGRSVQKMREIGGEMWRDLAEWTMRRTPLEENWALFQESLRGCQSAK